MMCKWTYPPAQSYDGQNTGMMIAPSERHIVSRGINPG